MICRAYLDSRLGSSTFSEACENGMKYLIELVYKKCWDVLEVRQYIRRFLLNNDDIDDDPEKLLDILNTLAAICLGESDDLPPPP